MKEGEVEVEAESEINVRQSKNSMQGDHARNES